MWRSAICGLACLTMVVVSAVTFWVGKTAQKAIADADIAIQHIDQTVGKVGTAADNIGGVIADERKAETKRDIEFYRTIAAGKETMVRVDKALTGHDGVLIKASEAISLIGDSVNTLALNGGKTLEAGARAADTLNSRMADPRIDTILSELSVSSLHFDSVTANLADATAHGDAILANGDKLSTYYTTRLTTPQGFVKTLGLGLWHLVIPATNIAIAIK